jgi:UPF0271 protein
VTVDLNADVGEGEGEAPLYRLCTSVNVACGGHAGTTTSMARAVALARDAGTVVGAHPGYPDRAGFGRRSLALDPAELCRSLRAQVVTLAGIAGAAGVVLRHVKPHGALYHDARHPEIADALADAIGGMEPAPVLVGFAGSPALDRWRGRGLRVAAEGFADRAYESDGSLRSRSLSGALVLDPRRAAEQALRLVRDGAVQTLCVHGDTPDAAAILAAVRAALEEAGVAVAPLRG